MLLKIGIHNLWIKQKFYFNHNIIINLIQIKWKILILNKIAYKQKNQIIIKTMMKIKKTITFLDHLVNRHILIKISKITKKNLLFIKLIINLYYV